MFFLGNQIFKNIVISFYYKKKHQNQVYWSIQSLEKVVLIVIEIIRGF